MEFENFIGIDISKETLDIALLTTEGEVINYKWNNDRKSLKKDFKTFFKEHNMKKNDTLICAEHTGHFGNKLVDVALEIELNLWLESAYSILHSQGLIRGKNDKVDALRIAEYAKRFTDKVILITPTPQSVKQLKLLNVERDLIVKDIQKYKAQLKQEKGFLEADYFKAKTKRIENLIKYLKQTLSEIENKIDDIINNDDHISSNYKKIISVDGVGKQTAITTIIATNNFTKFKNPRKFACHAGCAPFRYQSGTSLNSRNKVSQKANKNIKRILHMAALSAIQMKRELKEYYERKVAEGKNKMSVINAVRAKIIHRIFAVVIQNREYEKNYINSLG